jgi:ribosomal protein L7/L12
MLKCVFCNQPVSPGSTKCPKCGADLFPADVARQADVASPGTEGDIVSMLEQGRKIDAIRMYREQTGAGLREAKDAVDAIERGENLPAAARATGSAGVRADLKADVWALVQDGQKIQAIKFYRERTGCGLKQAKDAVEAVAREHGVAPNTAGCFGMILFWLALSGVLLGLVG